MIVVARPCFAGSDSGDSGDEDGGDGEEVGDDLLF